MTPSARPILIASLACANTVGLMAPRAVYASSQLLHDDKGRLISAPATVSSVKDLQICISESTEKTTLRVLAPSCGSTGAACDVAIDTVTDQGPPALKCATVPSFKQEDGLLRYRLLSDKPRGNKAIPLDRSRLKTLLEKIQGETQGIVASDSDLFSTPSPTAPLEDIELAHATRALQRLLDAGNAMTPLRQQMAASLLELERISETHVKWKLVQRTIREEAGRQVLFEGEYPIGRYRTSLYLSESGERIGPGTVSRQYLAPHDQLLFYLQRKGSTAQQVEVQVDGKGSFLSSPALPISQTTADWVVERVGDGTNFVAGKDIRVSVSRTAADKKEKVNELAIPVLESYRWAFTTGIYLSSIPRRKYYISDNATSVSNTTQVVTAVAPTGTTTTTTLATNTRGLVALDQPFGRQPSAGFFVSYNLRARTVEPGPPFRKGGLVPAIVVGAKIDAPLKEGLVGLGIEPVRGFQLILGRVKGAVVEAADGVEVGKPLDVVSTTVPTVDRFGKAKWFVAVAFDVKPLGDSLQKLLGKVF